MADLNEDASEARRMARTWWRGMRGAIPVDLFRIAVGLPLVAYFARHAIETVPLLTGSPALLGGSLADRSSWLASGLGPPALYATFAFATLLATGVATGYAARSCACALFGLSIAINWSLYPVLCVDDSAACLACLLLAALPTGSCLGAARLVSRTRARAPAAVPGGAVTVFLSFVVLLYLSGVFGEEVDGPTRPYVMLISRIVAVTMVVPSTAAQLLGTVLQVAMHGYLAATTSASFMNVALAASCILFWGEGRNPGPGPGRVDAGCVAAIALACTYALCFASPLLKIETGARRVLIDLTLLPVGAPSLASRSLFVRSDGDTSLAPATPAVGVRAAILAAQFATDDPGRTADVLAARIATRLCQDAERRGRSATVYVGEPNTDVRPAFRFECDASGRAEVARPEKPDDAN